MRRSILALVILGVVALPAAATAHGTCSAVAKTPVRSPDQVSFTGGFQCGTTIHDSMGANVYAQRRTPGQAWVTLDVRAINCFGADTCTTVLVTAGQNCAKDYRTHVAAGFANPGGHTGSKNAVSAHTC